MAKLLKLRRGTTSQHSSFTGAEGEVTVDTDKESLVVHNGSTAGGFPIARADGTGVSNFTITGELDAATLDISGNADIDGTLEADAYTVNGTALNEYISDTVGAMVGSNTETGIAVTYEDSDNTLDFAITSIPGVTFTGDVTFDNATHAGDDLTWDMSDKALEFDDDVKATFGDNGDLTIFHDGTNTMIDNDTGDLKISSSGVLRLRGDQVSIMDEAQTEGYINCYKDGAVKLYYDNSLKLETTSSGASVSGTNPFLEISGSAASSGDTGIFINANANHWLLKADNYTSGNQFQIRHGDTSSSEAAIACVQNGSVNLYNNGNLRLETTSVGNRLYGRSDIGDSTGGATDDRLTFGDSQDLQVYHNGTDSIISNGTGDFNVTTTGTQRFNVTGDFVVNVKAGTEDGLKVKTDGAVELYHNAIKTFETNASGITVRGPEGGVGAVYIYADEGDDNADQWRLQAADGADFTIGSYSTGSWQNEVTITNAGNLTALGNVTAYSDARLKTDIETLDNALDKVTKLRGVSYKRLDTQEAGIGVIAQEIENVLPEVVQDGAYKSVAYGNVVGLLIEAIKELKAELDEHKKTNCGGN